MELEKFCTFFLVVFWHISLLFFLFSCGYFFYRESENKREREREKEEVVVVVIHLFIHSFISFALQACICPSSSSLYKRRRRKISQYNNYYSLSLSYPIHTIELILSFSCLLVVVQFIYKFISTRIEKKKTYTFVCWTLTWRNNKKKRRRRNSPTPLYTD